MVFFFTYWMVKAPPGLRSLRTLFDRVAYACLRKQTNGRAHRDGGQRAAGRETRPSRGQKTLNDDAARIDARATRRRRRRPMWRGYERGVV